MIAKSSLLALRALDFLCHQDAGVAFSPRRIAEALSEFPSYLAKVLRHLVKGNILHAKKGTKGGVRLSQSPSQITLLAVVEACQGTVKGDYCSSSCPETFVCSFREATLELHEAISGILTRWTLARLLEKPSAATNIASRVACRMAGGSHIVASPINPAPDPDHGPLGGRRA